MRGVIVLLVAIVFLYNIRDEGLVRVSRIATT